MSNVETNLAIASLEIGAIKLSPNMPFQWASGYMMPIYNDNRMHLWHPINRQMIADGFWHLLYKEKHEPEVIAGTSTAGIPHAALLANTYQAPMIYIRDKPKSHGLKNQIEGIDADKDLDKKRVVVIEDLISTGGSSANAVAAVRDANGRVDYCLSIFNYGFDEAQQMFDGTLPYNKAGAKLDPVCKVRSLLTFDVLLQVARDRNYIKSEDVKLLEEWRAAPFEWGEKHGFPKVER